MGAALEQIATRAAELQTSQKKATNEDIARAVLRSQPPNAEDVPDMVDYNQMWGGGHQQYYVNDILHFLTVMNVPPSVRVSGRTFQALAALKYGVENVPAMAVNAVLKRMACSHRLVDGVAADYKTSDLTSLDKKRKKAFLEANQIMLNSRKILETNNISDPLRTKAEGWLHMTLIDHIMERPNLDGKTFESMELITASFLEKVFGMDSPPVEAAGPASALAAVAVVDYDDSGRAVDVPKQVLLSKGFKVGNRYTLTKPSAKPVVWELTHMAADGTSTLAVVSAIGTVTDETKDVDGATMASGVYRVFDKKFKFMTEYPKNEAKYSDAFHTAVQEGRVIDCLRTLALQQDDPQVRVQLSPFRGLFATGDIGIRELCLTPCTRSVVLVTSPYATTAAWQCSVVHDGNRSTKFLLKASKMDSEFCSGFFCVQSTTNKDSANVRIAERAVTFFEPMVAKQKTAVPSEAVAKIPCFVNFKSIKKDEQLLFFKAPEAKVEKPASALSLQLPSAKRQKTG